MKEHYNKILQGDKGALKRALYKSMGHTDEALRKPIIAIVNSYTDATAGHYTLNELAKYVQRGIESAGGTTMTFSTIAPCDGIAEGHIGMRYILPSRELVTSSIECMVRAHNFDGIVLLGSCDKIVPGMLMAAARLDVPSIFLNAGPMLPASYKGKHYDGNIVTEAIGWRTRGEITEEEFEEIENIAEPCAGSCAMLGTANTMSSLAEAMGMSLPGAAMIPAVYGARTRMGYETGVAIVNLVEKQITSRQIINKKSIENAMMTLMAIGGSTNAIMHLQAIYKESGSGQLALESFNEIAAKTPQVASVYPASEYDVVDFYEAGGIPAVLKELEVILNKDAMTCTGLELRDLLPEYKETSRKEVIKPFDEPFSKTGGVAVLTGNLAPLGAVVKPAAVPKHMMVFKGPAVVFHSENEAIEQILSGKIEKGSVLVLRYEGPKGGPGMPEMYAPMKHLEGMGLSEDCALITDGRFSGSNRGCFVGHISPEAYDGSTLAALKNGDIVEINIPERTLTLHVPNEEIESRLKSWERPEKDVPEGYLRTYQKISSSAAEGAVVE